MLTDEELRDTFAALDRSPTEAQIMAVLHAAQKPRRQRRLPALAFACTALAAVAVAFVIASLTSTDREQEAPVSAGSLLSRAAEGARGQRDFDGYRYANVVTQSRYPHPIRPQVVETRRETWVDRDWRGFQIVHRGRILEGPNGPGDRTDLERREGAFRYGDAPRAFPDRLPTDPGPLREAIVDSLHTEDWVDNPTDPVSRDAWIDYHVTRRVINLLEIANSTPELRAGLWEVLKRARGVAPAPDVRDPLGRPGEAIAIPNATGAGRIAVAFDPSTGALLFWSQSEGDDFERHTVVRSLQVARIGDR